MVAGYGRYADRATAAVLFTKRTGPLRGVIHGVERSIDRKFENARSKLIGLVIAHDNIASI